MPCCDHSRPGVQEVHISDSGLLTSGSEDFHVGPALNTAKTLLVLNEDTSVQRKQYIE